MYIYKSNLFVLLDTAIVAREKFEKKLKYTSDSALLAGWKALRKKINDEPGTVVIHACPDNDTL